MEEKDPTIEVPTEEQLKELEKRIEDLIHYFLSKKPQTEEEE
jgi:hypothetical protein